MALTPLTFPLSADDFFAKLLLTDFTMSLQARGETSGTQGGEIIAKETREPLWYAKGQSAPMYHRDMLAVQAFIESMGEFMQTFYGYDLRIPGPGYNDGAFNGDLLTASPVSRSSTATYWGSDGLLHTAAANVLRDAYDPVSHAYLGKVVEGTAATNLLEYDEEFDNTAWVKTGCSVTAGAATGVDGTATMDKMVEDTSTGTHFVTAVVAEAIAGGTQCVAAIDLKKGERTHAAVALMNNSGSPYENATVFIDLATGEATLTPSGVTNANFGVEQLPGDIWRVWVTCLLGSTVTLPSLVVWTSDGTSTSYAGDGSSGIYVDRAQLEVGTMPTSFIKTTSAVATRSADVLSIPATMLQWDEDALTVEFVGQALPGWSFIDFGQFDKGSLNQLGTFRWSVDAGGAAFYVQEPGGAEYTVRASATIDMHQPVTAKFFWNGKTIGVSVNAGPVQTYTMSVPASDFGFTRFILGAGSWFTQGGAIIKSVTMTPEPMVAGKAALSDVDGTNRIVTLSGLPTGYVLAPPDMLSFDYGPSNQSRALHRIVQGGTVASDGTVEVEVRPNVRVGWISGAAVSLVKPTAEMRIVPKTFTPAGSGNTSSFSFEAIQVL